MDKNRLQNIIFTVLGIAVLIGAGVQFTKNRNSALKSSGFSNVNEAQQNPLPEGSKGMEGSHKDESPSMDNHQQTSLNPSEPHAHEENIDHSDPKNQRRMGIYHYNEGNKLLAKKNWKEAIINYKMALNHDDKIFEAYINLSVAQLRGQEFDQAYLTLQKLRKLQPQNPSLYYNLACYYSLTNQLEFGKVAIQKATQLGFKNFQTLKNDPDLENLKDDPAYNKWLASL